MNCMSCDLSMNFVVLVFLMATQRHRKVASSSKYQSISLLSMWTFLSFWDHLLLAFMGEKKETSLHLNIKEDQRGVLYWMIQSAFGALSVMHYTSVQHLRALIKERVLRVVILWFLGKIRSELQCLVPFVTKWFVERNEEKTCSSISVWFK